MIKLRIMGTEDECAAFIQSLNPSRVHYVSHWYPNRGASREGRVYIDLI